MPYALGGTTAAAMRFNVATGMAVAVARFTAAAEMARAGANVPGELAAGTLVNVGRVAELGVDRPGCSTAAVRIGAPPRPGADELRFAAGRKACCAG